MTNQKTSSAFKMASIFFILSFVANIVFRACESYLLDAKFLLSVWTIISYLFLAFLPMKWKKFCGVIFIINSAIFFFASFGGVIRLCLQTGVLSLEYFDMPLNSNIIPNLKPVIVFLLYSGMSLVVGVLFFASKKKQFNKKALVLYLPLIFGILAAITEQSLYVFTLWGRYDLTACAVVFFAGLLKYIFFAIAMYQLAVKIATKSDAGDQCQAEESSVSE